MKPQSPSPRQGGWTARERRHAHDHGPGVWALVYGTLWLQIAWLAAMVFLPRPDAASRLMLYGWVLGTGVLLLYVVYGWAAFHDLLIGCDLRQRAALEVLLVAGCIAGPWLTGRPLLPDALLWAATAMLPISVTPGMLRRGLAFSLLGAWFAARGLPGPAGLGLTLGFGALWLLALGAAHLGFIAEPFALRGWMLPRLALRNMLYVALPSAGAGLIVYSTWKQRGVPSLRSSDPVGQVLEQLPLNPAQPVGPDALMNALLQLAIAMGLMIASLIVLHFLMRRFKKRHSGLLSDLLPGQVGRPRDVPLLSGGPRGLQGRRGEIVRLWSRWARAQPVPEGRDLADTAREFAQRANQAEAAPAPETAAEKQAATALLEQAHYDATEPGEAEVEQMRRLTMAAIARQEAERKKK